MNQHPTWRRSPILAILPLVMSTAAMAQDADNAPAEPASGPPESVVEAYAVETPQGRRLITLNMPQGSIRTALRLVAEQGGLNIVVGPEVEGDVSVYLTNATIRTALRAIAENNGFIYELRDGIINVSKPRELDADHVPPMTTRVFNLRSRDAERVRDALEYALTQHGKMKVLNENGEVLYRQENLSNLSASAGGNQGGTTSNAGTGINTGATNDGAGSLRLLGEADKPRGARTLIVTDVPENLEQVAQLIADLDRLPPQVLIEARIIEMSTDLQRQLGIDWDVNVLANGPILAHTWPLTNRAGFTQGSTVRFDSGGLPQNPTGLALGVVDFSALTALVRIHQTDNAMRLLANPRMLVHNNQSASILVGERYPLLRSNITDFGTVTESFDGYIPVGIQLEVTPTILMDGRISMYVHPATSAIGDDVVGTTGLRVARIRTREMDTRVIMRDGQTVVLGGLISDRKTRQTNKIPGLGDLPVADIFFRQENPRSERVDLLIFITARIDGAAEFTEHDRRVYEMYQPHFKHVEKLQDVQLHFEIPTEYAPPRPMFGDPVDPEGQWEAEQFEGEEWEEVEAEYSPPPRDDNAIQPAAHQARRDESLSEKAPPARNEVTWATPPLPPTEVRVAEAADPPPPEDVKPTKPVVPAWEEVFASEHTVRIRPVSDGAGDEVEVETEETEHESKKTYPLSSLMKPIERDLDLWEERLTLEQSRLEELERQRAWIEAEIAANLAQASAVGVAQEVSAPAPQAPDPSLAARLAEWDTALAAHETRGLSKVHIATTVSSNQPIQLAAGVSLTARTAEPREFVLPALKDEPPVRQMAEMSGPSSLIRTAYMSLDSATNFAWADAMERVLCGSAAFKPVQPPEPAAPVTADEPVDTQVALHETSEEAPIDVEGFRLPAIRTNVEVRRVLPHLKTEQIPRPTIRVIRADEPSESDASEPATPTALQIWPPPEQSVDNSRGAPRGSGRISTNAKVSLHDDQP